MKKSSEEIIVHQFLNSHEASRYKTLLNILEMHNVDHYTEHGNHDTKNVIVSLTNETPYTLLVAHYDVFGSSTGINDNTCALALLIQIAKTLSKTNTTVPLKILFTDKEEQGMYGSYDYANKHQDEIQKVIVFDIIGYGDQYFYGADQNASQAFQFLNELGINRLSMVLPSDNLMFANAGIKSTLITALPNEDVQLQNQEYHLKASPKFVESFHNNALDNDINVINFDLIERLRKTLIHNYSCSQDKCCKGLEHQLSNQIISS